MPIGDILQYSGLDIPVIISENVVYVNAELITNQPDGTVLHPYTNMDDAITNAPNGAVIKQVSDLSITAPIVLPQNKKLTFVSDNTSEIKYVTGATKDNIFEFTSSSIHLPSFFSFKNLSLRNCKYGIKITGAVAIEITDCSFSRCGWEGNYLSTRSEGSASLEGLNSTQAELQTFAADHTIDGGAVHLSQVYKVAVLGNRVDNCFRGLRFEDCGAPTYTQPNAGSGYVGRNIVTDCIESGIYLASSTYNELNGCENFKVYLNSSSYNANNGILSIGGANNAIGLNTCEHNWNGGVVAWHPSELTVQNNHLTSNNKNTYNGIGNIGDAAASIQIDGGGYRLFKEFIANISSNTILNTGTGSSVEATGLCVSAALDSITTDNPIITLDNNLYQSTEIGVKLECDLNVVKVFKGDESFVNVTEHNVEATSAGNYYELPYSSHHTFMKELDIRLGANNTLYVHEGVNGDLINPYWVGSLYAVRTGNHVTILLTDSRKIQFDNTLPTNITLDGASLNSDIDLAVNEINTFIQQTGSANSALPVINSSMAVTLVEGNSLNYLLVTDYASAHTWGVLPGNLAVNDTNARNLLGGTDLAVGTYSIPVSAINDVGVTTATLVITVVSNASFTNTKSTAFTPNQQGYLEADGAKFHNIFGRNAHGDGTQPWTLFLAAKPSTSASGRVLLYIGSDDQANDPYIEVRLTANNKLRFHIGTDTNFLRWTSTAPLSYSWEALQVSYNGLRTGNNPSDLNTYFANLHIAINGVQVAGNWSSGQNGWANAIVITKVFLGRPYNNTSYASGERIQHLAVWDSDERTNAAAYAATPQIDFNSITNKPVHWFPLGDYATFPTYSDISTNPTNGTTDIVQAYNMVSSNIVTDSR